MERLAIHLRDSGVDTGLARTIRSRVRSPEGAQRARDVQDPLDPERGTNARRALQAIENVSTWLSDVQGRRKALLFFSEGIDYDIYEPFNRSFASGLVQDTQQAVAAAQRANVNVYGMDPRGLSQFSGDLVEISGRSDYPQLEYGNFRGALRELLLSQESLIGLSEQTGGLAIVNQNDVAGGLGRIVLDNSRYYLLGYYSDSSRWQGKFLKIDVRMKRPNLQVRARRGYLPPNNRAAQRAREAEVKAGTTPALRAALSKPVPGRRPAVPRVRGADAGHGRQRVGARRARDRRIVTQVPGAQRPLRRIARGVDRRGRPARAHRQRSADLRAQPHAADARAGQPHGRPHALAAAMPAGRYQIRVGVHETSGGTLATVPSNLEVPDFSKAPFALSGILVTSSNAESFATANPDPELKEILSASPIVSRTFSREDTLTWFAEAYDNSSTAARSVLFETTVQDVRDGRTVFRARDQRSIQPGDKTRGQGLSTRMPLKDLQSRRVRAAGRGERVAFGAIGAP